MSCCLRKYGVGCCRGIQLLYELLTVMDPRKVKILNEEEDSAESESHGIISEPTEIVGLSKELHRQVLKLKGDFLQESGKVNYKNLRGSLDFQNFKKECGKLRCVDLSSSNDIDRKAFFLNIYNILTTHALGQNVQDETTVLQLSRFWQAYAYKIGAYVFSLDDIEHGVLRCNQLHPTSKEYFFKEGDPRRQFVQTDLDPRLHFALNCGAASCPPIRLFSADNLDNALDLAAKSFCQQEIKIDVDKKEISATKILTWYGSDFGPDEKSIMQRVAPYLTPDQQADLGKIMNNFKLTYSEYDWSIH